MMTVWLVNSLAIGFLFFLAFLVIRSAYRRTIKKRHVLEAVRVIAVLVAVALAVGATRGEIGLWGIWLGIGMVTAAALTVFIV